MSTVSFAADAYLHAKSVWGGVRGRRRRVRNEPGLTRPFGRGRDPHALGDVLASVSEDMGWNADLEQARVLAEWPELAGASTAEHTTVIGVSKGVLQVQCDSTTWATELRRLRGEILTRLLHEYPESGIRDIRFLAPGAPSWRHGPRVVRGRGPRDTYG